VSDPLSELVRLLQPRAVFANVISGKGQWAVRYTAYGRPSFCIVLEGGALLDVEGQPPIQIRAGDFVLLPTTPPFTLSSFGSAPPPVLIDPEATPGGQGERRHGEQDGAPDMRSLGGAFQFASPDTSLLASLLPPVVHVRDSSRLMQLVQMVGEEYEHPQPGSTYMLSRLVEMLLVEAMRWSAARRAPPGLLRGLGDARLAMALKHLHARIEHPWTVDELAKAAALSRSNFFARFTRTVGLPPMAYLLTWRMEIAKDLLRRDELTIAEIADRIGYGSTSAFSVAFRRHVGKSPSRFATP